MSYKTSICILIIISFILILSFFTSLVYSFDTHDTEYTNEIIINIESPTIERGDEDILYFTLQNPYPEGYHMENISLNVSIFRYVHLDEEKEIEEIDDPPTFKNEKTYFALQEEDEKIEGLTSEESKDFKMEISTGEATDQGVYTIKFDIEFDLYEQNEIKERTKLDEELPETTFAVEDQLPRWPQYLLGIFTGTFGLLAVMFYFQEKYNKFPKLEKAFDKFSRKFEKLWSRFK